MAGSGAVRGTGSLLLRALTLGGLTAAAWLISGAIASSAHADTPEEPVPPAEAAVVEETADTARPDLLGDLLADPAEWSATLTENVLQLSVAPPPKDEDAEGEKVPAKQNLFSPSIIAPAKEDDESSEPQIEYSSSYTSGTRSGTVSNRAPEHVMVAKAEARAARMAARQAAATPPPAPAPVVPNAPVKQTFMAQPFVPMLDQAADDQAADSDLDWTNPRPAAPMPAPQPAPAPTAPTASSSHHDNSGGTRGVLAVQTSQSALFPPTTWSVEHRTDGRSPGSLPGLPSTSPD